MTTINKSAGFTLVEIMIVVAILGVLAAVAIPSFSQYMNHAKKSEAQENLRSIGDGAVAFFNTDHFYGPNGLTRMRGIYPHCPDDQGNAQPCGLIALCEDPEVGVKMKPDSISDKLGGIGVGKDDDDKPTNVRVPWPQLGFSLTSPFYYCYAYENTDGDNSGVTTFQATATASLQKQNDSIFRMQGEANGRLTPIVEIGDDD